MKLKFLTLDEALTSYLHGIRVATHGEIGQEVPKYAECDIRIHIYPSGGGYIHLMNQDSPTFDFISSQ